ncbi:MAG: aminopeptidase P family protein [Deltaproteobacteria bacterium]|nr:aminopeptidase P family protein [Deltaproteobacteria bacterium]
MNNIERCQRLSEGLQANHIDVAVLLKPHNVFYLTGYAPVCAGVLLFPEEEPIFCTLWLDGPEARERCALPRLAAYVYPRETLGAKLIELIRKRKISPARIGVEKDFMLLRDYEALAREFPGAEFVHITPAVDRLRAVKSDEEVEMIRKSAAISDKAMEAALKAVAPGASELDIAAEAEYVMKKMGSEKTAFSTFVASGKRTLLAHPIASRRTIESGDSVVIDLGATWEGYASDICRTTFAGDPRPEQIDFLRTVVDAQKAATEILRNGETSGAVYDKVFEVFQRAGLEKHLPGDIGYGVGLRQSEFYPVIEKGSRTILEENMVIALLQTTSYTRNLGGLRVEDTFRVTGTGCEQLTLLPQPHL